MDPVALRRSLAGERLPMTATERAVVAHHLARQGLRAAQFAYRLGLGTPTVRRLLDRGCVEYLEHHWR